LAIRFLLSPAIYLKEDSTRAETTKNAIKRGFDQLGVRLAPRARSMRSRLQQDYRNAVRFLSRDRHGAMLVTRDELRGSPVSVQIAIAKFPGVV